MFTLELKQNDWLELIINYFYIHSMSCHFHHNDTILKTKIENKMGHLFCACLMVAAVASSSTPPGLNSPKTDMSFSFNHALVITSQRLEELRQTPSLLLVYFFINELPRTSRKFFEEYDKSAKYLEAYNVQLAVFDCKADMSKEEHCSNVKAGRNVYSYKNGRQLLEMEVETMFDVNSIMSHALQLVLLQDVQIIQSRLERQALQKSMIGKNDIFFAYTQAIGTKEHRIFMEIAYTYQDRYKFALTTELKSTLGLQENEYLKSSTSLAMWVLFCSDSNPEQFFQSGNCHHIMYKGEISLAAVATFVKNLAEPVLYHCPTNEISSMKNLPLSLPTIFIYSNRELADFIKFEVDSLVFDVRGFARIMLVEMDNGECQAQAKQQGFHGKLPSIGIQLQNGEVAFMSESTEWLLSTLHEFLEPYLYPIDHSAQESNLELAHSTDLERITASLIEEVETQDDQVADAVFRLHLKEMELDLIPPLAKNNFYSTLKSAELKMVLFYLPFDQVSMAFLRDFGEASQILSTMYSDHDVLARVNCFDATDLCAAENITTYPLIRIYQRDEETQDYRGHLYSKSIINAVKLLQLKSPVLLKSEKEVEMFMERHFPNKFSEFSSSAVLLLSHKEHQEARSTFVDVTKSMSTITAFGIVTEELVTHIAKKYGAPITSVIAFRQEDINRQKSILAGKISVASLTDFVKQSTISSLPELTQINFPLLYEKKLPFAILFVDPDDQSSEVAKEMFTKLAMTGQFEKAIFCYMDAQPKTIGLKILSEYTWTATLPAISVVDHRLGEVFNYPGDNLEQSQVANWLDSVFSNKEKPAKILEQGVWVAPGRHYDFLAMMDEKRSILRIQAEEESNIEAEDSSLTNGARASVLLTEDELLKIDEDIREELLELRNSRLYHQSPERRKPGKTESPQGHSVPLVKQDVAQGHGHSHTEL
ncbi:unnamed protein product [Lymnaea stagnalis]|uniref:Thioredoxin domain-containing protein n=1 Tax=Lymnaea stagnalis TaxID=6523 RepID=A0AAV2HBR4_LYMST